MDKPSINDCAINALKEKIEQNILDELKPWTTGNDEQIKLAEVVNTVLKDLNGESHAHRFSAGELREMGFEIDESIPDCATAEGRLETTIDPSETPFEMVETLRFVPFTNFEWINLDYTIE